MAKDKLTDYDSTAANNLDVGGISVAEGMLPSGVNNAIRELMSHQADAFGAGTPLYVDQTNNRVGIGNAAPTTALEVDANGATVATFDRATSDGSIIDLRKDGSTVGSIGSTSSNLYVATTTSGVRFNSNGSIPCDNTGATADDTYDLGQSSVRWQDLYLSGGVYLGGTGSANYLDDYEEGTWTPYYEPDSGSFSSITYDVAATYGSYTKIGDRVFFEGRIRTDALTVGTASGGLYLNGLPFASNIGAGGISIGYTTSWAGNSARMGYFPPSGTRVNLVDTNSSTGNSGTLNVTDMATGTNANHIYFSGHYRTSE